MQLPKGTGVFLMLLGLAAPASSQVGFTDDFNQPVNYLVNGVSGTIWDGIYLGAGEFSNTSIASTTGSVAGSTSVCNANISVPNELTVTSTGTGWEKAEDDGFFLFKNVAGDFSARVHIIIPYD